MAVLGERNGVEWLLLVAGVVGVLSLKPREIPDTMHNTAVAMAKFDLTVSVTEGLWVLRGAVGGRGCGGDSLDEDCDDSKATIAEGRKPCPMSTTCLGEEWW